MRLLLYVLVLISSSSSLALNKQFSSNASYEICFTPKNNCTQLIVNMINKANVSVLIQTYGLNSSEIVDALLNAKRKGLDVQVMLDKSQKRRSYSTEKLINHGDIPIWIDYKPVIAYNKIIIIDKRYVLTGFNFNKLPQYYTESVLIIDDTNLAKFYFDNWENRKSMSQRYKGKFCWLCWD